MWTNLQENADLVTFTEEICNEKLFVVDPFWYTSVTMLDYWTPLFEEGLEYNAIGVRRSAISVFHEKFDDMPVGQHRL